MTPNPALAPDEARAIAKEAYIYGFPLVDNYRIMHSYSVDQNNPEYKAPFNKIKSTPRVYTPEDKAVQTPNSDTPYSFIGVDLRNEPVVFTLPAMEPERYFSVQLIDLYTHNFAYLGTRTTGNNGGIYMLAGPNWKGETPAGIDKVIPCETQILLALIRTQVFDPADLENVKKIQQGYKLQTLSAFLGQPAPPPAPEIDFIKPLSPEEQSKSFDFFKILNFALSFCPTHPSEVELMKRFANLGIGGDQSFDASSLSPELKESIAAGIADAWITFAGLQKQISAGEVTSGDIFGTREFLKNNYLYRMAAAKLGIYGNSREEAIYPVYMVDDASQRLNGSNNRYSLRFGPGELPPVNAFWSLTMYDQPASLLVANPINRYLLNSPMLPNMALDSDGGITLHIQHESPGPARETNWLPAPNGPFWMVLRLYNPKPEGFNGSWRNPPLKLV